MINLLFVIPSLNRAGAQMHVLDLSRKLDRARFNIRILTILREPATLDDDFAELGISVDSIQDRPVGFLRTCAASFKYLRNTQVDIIHIHDVPLYGFMILWLSHLAKVPIRLCTIHGLWRFRGAKGLVFTSLVRLTSRKGSAFVFVSQAAREFWQNSYAIPAAHSIVIPNGVDLAVFRPLSRCDKRPLLNLPAEIPVIGCVGGLTARKGQHYLLDAVARVVKRIPNTRLVMVGEGELREQLQEQAESLGISESVIFLGVRKDVNVLMQEFDCLAVSSAFDYAQQVGESFGIVILEAMAAAKPVVATDFSGFKEVVVDGETGLLVPPADPASMADALLRILENRNLAVKLGEAGRRRAETEFPDTKVAARLSALYRSLLADKGYALNS